LSNNDSGNTVIQFFVLNLQRSNATVEVCNWQQLALVRVIWVRVRGKQDAAVVQSQALLIMALVEDFIAGLPGTDRCNKKKSELN
jgi:hypothetical protein